MYIASELVVEATLHRALVRSSCVLQPKGHCVVVEHFERRDERRFLLIFDLQSNMIVV